MEKITENPTIVKTSKEIFKAENDYKRAYLTNHAQIYR